MRHELEHRLGSAIHHFDERQGGFSHGVLGVATLHTGEQVFIKSVHTDAANARDYRTETTVAHALPQAIPTPRLRFACEKADWLLLCFDLAPGALPHQPWLPAELSAALDTLTVCARELPPAPIPGLPTLAQQMAGRCETWRALEHHGTHGPLTIDDLGPWERRNLTRLAATEAVWTDLVVGDTLLHFDPRYDNILISPDGTARLVDWGRACTGPAWADPVCLLLQSDLGDLDPEPILADHPTGRNAHPDHLDASSSPWPATGPTPPHSPDSHTPHTCATAANTPDERPSPGSDTAGPEPSRPCADGHHR